MRPLVSILGFLASLVVSASASAVCLSPASTNPSLFSELVKWSTSNDTTVTIKLEQGIYNIDVGLDQRGPGQHECCGSGGFNAGLVLKGGYKPNTNCDDNQRSLDASLTILDGGGGQFYLWSNGSMTLSVLTFRNYLDFTGVTFFGLTGTDNPLTATHVIGAGNERIEMDGSSVSAADILVYGQPISSQAALNLTATDTAVTATHLTIVGNGGAGLSVADQYGGNLPISIFNSIFWANKDGDIVGYDADDNNGIFVTNSLASVSTFPAEPDYLPANHLISVANKDPLFHDSANDDFTLETDPLSPSPAINAGTSAVIGGEPGTDIAGNPRIIGGVPDMGAFESATSFFATYTVTTKTDNGDNASPTVNSLRWALKNARASALVHTGMPHRIVFNIPSGCPALIVPSPAGSAFPAIDFDLTIDATTEPGWQPNTTLQGFDATLCIGINGSGVYANAFRTTAGGRLTVLGMRFGGFADAALRLDGGSGHQIYGNQIGGAGIGLLQTNSSNHHGVRVTGATGTSFVGTFDDASTRNMIIDNSSVGVYVDSVTDAGSNGIYIVNNLIGLGSNGATPVPNGSGIFVDASARNIIEYNTISASTGVGITISGANAQYNTVKFNAIGVPESGAGMVANGTQAIVVNTGAANNTLGGSTGGNLIAATAQGVYISSSGGSGNRVLTNSYLYTASLPIDLGAAGTTPNDLGDGDAGPDNQQNFPVVLHAYRTNSYEWIEGTLDTFFSNESFRLEFYRSGCCSGPYNTADYIGHDASGATVDFGHVHFWARLPKPADGTPLGSIGATAMAPNGDTSEIGTSVAESTDMIFRDDFDHAN